MCKGGGRVDYIPTSTNVLHCVHEYARPGHTGRTGCTNVPAWSSTGVQGESVKTRTTAVQAVDGRLLRK